MKEEVTEVSIIGEFNGTYSAHAEGGAGGGAAAVSKRLTDKNQMEN